MSLWSRIANAFRSGYVNREIDEELESHIQEAVESGRDPEEVRRVFGAMLRHREASRDARVVLWLDSLRADVIFGWRQLRKHKVTSVAAVLSLALPMGSCIAAFRLIDALLLRPLPVAHPERLYVVAFRGPGPDGKDLTYDSSSYPMFREMREAVKEQADVVAVSYADRQDLTYGSDEEMERAYLQYVSGSMFGTLGVRPTVGRLLTESDDLVPGAHPLAVLSYDYWTHRFGQDPNVIGRTFRVNQSQFQIIGVTEQGFAGTETGTMTDIFAPMMMKNPQTLASSHNFWLRTFVQLRASASPGAVRRELDATFRTIIQEQRAKEQLGLPKQVLDALLQEQLLLEPAGAGRSNLQRDYRRPLEALGVLVALVLLIASANVANLMTARAAARGREIAMRVAIGARRARLVQLFLTEAALLALLSIVCAALFAAWASPLMVSMINPQNDPARLVLSWDWRVLAFLISAALTVTVIFGLGPAMRVSAIRPVAALKGGDFQSKRRLLHVLTAVQSAFCVVVLFCAGLFGATFDRLVHQPTGFSAERVLNLEALSQRPQPPAFWEQAAEHLRTVSGVEGAAMTGWPVMSGESAVGFISINGAQPSDVFSDFVRVSPGWFDLMKIPIRDGRDFRNGENNPGVAIVNKAFAKQYFGGENPVGRVFERVDGPGAQVSYQVVGFVPDARSRDNLRLPIRPTVYVPFSSVNAAGALERIQRGTFVVRTAAANPLALASILRREVPRVRPELYVSNIRTQTEINLAHTLREHLLASLAKFFGGVALVLAGIGLYGVLHYSVLQQRREIGIRLAIGARGMDITRDVTKATFCMVLAGAIAGLWLGTLATRSVQALFFGVRPTDLPMLVLPGLTMFVTALLAALPAIIHAVQTDPVATLRAD